MQAFGITPPAGFENAVEGDILLQLMTIVGKEKKDATHSGSLGS